ncbi:hypothetical protein [Thalassospira lucentensis]|uniref:hypothetical protein n=1 Tax=Thalassospira lucentensis TaxID=168935 RepID=UPI00142E8E91|nr:hypothetical protein [Thalassospira lucentensis]NIZ03687.1 hypothetical protein [Thalassospira lucentensis]
MLSLRDIIDFAAMSDDLAHELNKLQIGVPDLGAALAGQNGAGSEAAGGCEVAPCGPSDIDGK